MLTHGTIDEAGNNRCHFAVSLLGHLDCLGLAEEMQV
jgi:hypothetical protein